MELNKLQFIFEIALVVGYAIGLIPFGFLISAWWVIPIAVGSLVVSIMAENGTKELCIVNLIFAIFSLVPVLGYLTRIGGIIVSTKHIIDLYKKI